MTEGIELTDGGIIEEPDDELTIRRRDVHGNLEEIRRIGDANHCEWLALFPGAEIRQQLSDALCVLGEFVGDVKKRGLETVGKDWQELLITYNCAVEILA